MAVTTKRKEDAVRFKSEIQKYWAITDHGEISWFLSFEIRRDRKARTLSINQKSFIEATVEKFGLSEAKPISTPMEPNIQLSTKQSPSTANQSLRMRGVPYSQAIGSVLWPVVVSRPDAAYAVGILSKFMQNPGQAHWEAFGGEKDEMLQGYCDADWASQEHRHSISGYSFHFGAGAVSWSSKKQAVIALSSTEAEYIAQTHGACVATTKEL